VLLSIFTHQSLLIKYGFSKVRRGPDTDMYAHPSFLRGYSDLLSELKKCKSAADRKRLSKTTIQSSTIGNIDGPLSLANNGTRAVSPSSSEDDSAIFSHMRGLPGQYYDQHSHFNMGAPYNPVTYTSEQHLHPHRQQMSLVQHQSTHKTTQSQPSGKLDLLTLAITCLADSNKLQSS